MTVDRRARRAGTIPSRRRLARRRRLERVRRRGRRHRAHGLHVRLLAYVPAWFGDDLDSSVALGSAAITAMLVTGAVGTYLGGRLADTYGRRRGGRVTGDTVPLASSCCSASPGWPCRSWWCWA